MADIAKENEKLTKQCKEAEEKLRSSEQKYSQEANKLKAATEDIAKLKQTLSTTQNENAQIKQKIQEANKKIEEEKNEKSKQIEAIKKLQAEITNQNIEMKKIKEDADKQNEKMKTQQKNDIDKKDAEIKSLQAEITNKNGEIKKIKEDTDKKIEEIKTQQKKDIDKKDAEIKKLKEELDQQSIQKNKQQEDFNQLNTNIIELQEIIKQLGNSLKERESEADFSYKKLLETQSSLEEKNSQLGKQQKELDELYQKLEMKANVPEEVKLDEGSQEKEFHDVHIDCSSMFNLRQKGWNILTKDYQRYQEKISKGVRRITALGLENRGKSFLLGHIMGRKIPMGQHFNKQGLYVTYPEGEDDAQCCLEISSVHQPIRTAEVTKNFEDLFNGRDQSEIEELLLADASLFENLMTDFAILHSEIILIVVDKLQRLDQSMIKEILNKKYIASKTIYIVHNWKDCSTLKQKDIRIKQDIIDTFGATEKIIKKNESVYSKTHEVNGKNLQIEHIVLMNNQTVEGEKYNANSIEYIKKRFDTKEHNQPFDLINEFYIYLKNRLNDYFGRLENYTPEFDDLELHLNDQNIPVRFQLKNPQNYFIRSNTYDQMGLMNQQNSNIALNYAIKQTEVDDKNQRILAIFCDVNGNIKNDQIRAELQLVSDIDNKKLHRITLKGIVEDPIQEMIESKGYKDISKDKRKFGEFMVVSGTLDLGGFEAQQYPNFIINKMYTGQFRVEWILEQRTYIVKAEKDYNNSSF